jgi:hypothetical protein
VESLVVEASSVEASFVEVVASLEHKLDSNNIVPRYHPFIVKYLGNLPQLERQKCALKRPVFGWLYHVTGQAAGGLKNHKERLAGWNVDQQLHALPVPNPVSEN